MCHSDCKYRLVAEMMQINSIKIGEECSTYNIQHDKGKLIAIRSNNKPCKRSL